MDGIEVKVKQQILGIYDEETICIYDDDTSRIVYEDTAENAKTNGTPYDDWLVIDIEVYNTESKHGYPIHGIMINAWNPNWPPKGKDNGTT